MRRSESIVCCSCSRSPVSLRKRVQFEMSRCKPSDRDIGTTGEFEALHREMNNTEKGCPYAADA
jgi:hypothetical protein